MKILFLKNFAAFAAIVLVIAGTSWAVQHFHRPGQLDVISAQAMDMSQMRPPSGAAPVALTSVRQGSLADTVTYTGTVQAYNEQEISPRVTGTLVALPVYPGDTVRAGQVVAQLDTAELSAKAAQGIAGAQQALQGISVARLGVAQAAASVSEADAKIAAAEQAVADARAQAQAARDAVTESQSGVTSAQANADYWHTEIVREKQLADAGAVSQQEYQNELAQAQAAQAALQQSHAKVRQAQAMVTSADAKVAQSRREVTAARAGRRTAQAGEAIAAQQVQQESAGTKAAQAGAREAAVVQGYTRIESPANGVVTARPVAPGTLVQPGTVLLKIAEIGKVRLQANVAVADLAGIHVGSPVLASLVSEGGKPFTTHVSAVFPAASSQTRTAVVEAVVSNPGDRLLPGAFVTLKITKETVSDKLLVPASAVVSHGGQSYVWTAGGGAAGQVYECVICHIHYTAAQAKKFHYKDPMEGGKLVPLKGGQPAPPATGLTAHKVTVQGGASDGVWTEVSSDALSAGTRVVAHGQAGLTDGARVISTAWGADGPKTLPTAAAAMGSQTVYRCEKCGMTFSEEDAKRHNFIDPMDGGRLVPVKPAAPPVGPSAGSMPGMKM